jgi:hypothetical protein
MNNEPIPDLDCEGALYWDGGDLEPGDVLTGVFTVGNIGEPNSELDWRIMSCPFWGTWTFDPESGTGLTPEDGFVTIDVELILEVEINETLYGEIGIQNVENESDICYIDIQIKKKSSDDELVEFEVEFCGFGKKHTVKLTQQEADEVELLFDDIEQRLSEVETKEEAEEIFKDAVVELDKYGLLGGLSVRQAQRLVTQNYKALDIVPNYITERYLSSDDNGSNYLCLIAGETTNTFFMGIPAWATILFLYVLGFGMPLGSYLLTCLLSLIKTVGNIINPISIFNFIGIGVMKTRDGLEFFPADGWLWTIGLNGIKSWNGTFAGDFGPIIMLWFMMRFYYSGVLGFTGIKLFFNNKHFYLGTALQVDMFYPE